MPVPRRGRARQSIVFARKGPDLAERESTLRKLAPLLGVSITVDDVHFTPEGAELVSDIFAEAIAAALGAPAASLNAAAPRNAATA